MKISMFWFRRDLRLEDNTALHQALISGFKVLPIFIFDDKILSDLPKNDARVSFIYDRLSKINQFLTGKGSSLLCMKGNTEEIWGNIIEKYEIDGVYANKDYEPYAIERDTNVEKLLNQKGVRFNLYKDQVIFEENEILKTDGNPYTIFTPYKNKWFENFDQKGLKIGTNISYDNFLKTAIDFPNLNQLGFKTSDIKVKNYDLSIIKNYAATRNFPFEETTRLGPHLRFGTISIRRLVVEYGIDNPIFLNELIWREFFMQILYHFPEVILQNFKRKYDGIKWRNNEAEFNRWCNGETGYPFIDAGMRELNYTGYMHNRVRMIVASFLCKHLLVDWRWGEAYFAEKLLDYELSSNNGNWQWVAGTGCDAAPYFRIFNPSEQIKKFDKELIYTKKWVPEFETNKYCNPVVEHKSAR